MTTAQYPDNRLDQMNLNTAWVSSSATTPSFTCQNAAGCPSMPTPITMSSSRLALPAIASTPPTEIIAAEVMKAVLCRRLPSREASKMRVGRVAISSIRSRR